MSWSWIEFNRERLERLKLAYSQCCESGDDVFEFEGVSLVCAYAHYLIQYLEGVLPKE